MGIESGKEPFLNSPGAAGKQSVSAKCCEYGSCHGVRGEALATGNNASEQDFLLTCDQAGDCRRESIVAVNPFRPRRDTAEHTPFWSTIHYGGWFEAGSEPTRVVFSFSVAAENRLPLITS